MWKSCECTTFGNSFYNILPVLALHLIALHL
jgi:hypothetical protein